MSTIWEFVSVIYSRLLAFNNKHLGDSKVFCMSPWIQLHAQTDGKISPCCMSAVREGNEIGDLKKNADLTAAWNSPNMRQLRLNMLNGVASSICSNCYKHEELGKFSERMQYNKDFKRYYNRVVSTLSDGTVKNGVVPVIDIRFSNKCNYKCRICNSDYSSLWYEEELKLGKNLSGQPKEKWVAEEEEKFWSSFTRLLPYVKRLHFAGGEPLFMDEHYRVLEHLIAIGKNDVNLTYNTNLSTLRYKKYYVTEYWKKFKKVDVWASLDGMNARGDYQRKGQKWSEIETNIRVIQADCPKVFLGVNVTVSIFNLLHVPQFIKHLIENNLVTPDRINLYPLFYPHAFSISNLTAELKIKAEEEYLVFDESFLTTLKNPEKLRNHIYALMSHMKNGESNLKDEFRKKVKEVDDLRGENFIDVFPELRPMLVTH